MSSLNYESRARISHSASGVRSDDRPGRIGFEQEGSNAGARGAHSISRFADRIVRSDRRAALASSSVDPMAPPHAGARRASGARRVCVRAPRDLGPTTEEPLKETLEGVARFFAIAFALFVHAIRLYAVEVYGRVIHEFDPWFNFRATQYWSITARRSSSAGSITPCGTCWGARSGRPSPLCPPPPISGARAAGFSDVTLNDVFTPAVSPCSRACSRA